MSEQARLRIASILIRGNIDFFAVLGLCIYGIGTIIFWPCAVLTSFPGFLISNFVVGFGLAVLESMYSGVTGWIFLSLQSCDSFLTYMFNKPCSNFRRI